MCDFAARQRLDYCTLWLSFMKLLKYLEKDFARGATFYVCYPFYEILKIICSLTKSYKTKVKSVQLGKTLDLNL